MHNLVAATTLFKAARSWCIRVCRLLHACAWSSSRIPRPHAKRAESHVKGGIGAPLTSSGGADCVQLITAGLLTLRLPICSGQKHRAPVLNVTASLMAGAASAHASTPYTLITLCLCSVDLPHPTGAHALLACELPVILAACLTTDRQAPSRHAVTPPATTASLGLRPIQLLDSQYHSSSLRAFWVKQASLLQCADPHRIQDVSSNSGCAASSDAVPDQASVWTATPVIPYSLPQVLQSPRTPGSLIILSQILQSGV